MSSGPDFIEGLLDETREEVNRADSKASMLLAALGVAIAVLGGALSTGDMTLTGSRGAVQAAAIASGCLLLLGLILLGVAICPRIRKGSPGAARYFMDYAQYDNVGDLRAAVDAEGRNRSDRHLRQLRDLSRIVRTKYRLTSLAIAATGLGAATAILAPLLHLWLSK